MTALSKSPKLFVMARTLSFRYKGIKGVGDNLKDVIPYLVAIAIKKS